VCGQLGTLIRQCSTPVCSTGGRRPVGEKRGDGRGSDRVRGYFVDVRNAVEV